MSAMLILVFAAALSAAGPSSLPSVSVTGVAATPNPALRGNTLGSVSVAAAVAATFDADSSTLTLGRCVANRQAGTSARTDTTAVVTVTGTGTTASASDGTSTASLAVSGGSATGSLTIGAEGKDTVTVSATASETYTTRTDTTSSSWANTGCSGAPSSSSTTAGTPTSTVKTGSGSGSGSYIVDLVGPTISKADLTPGNVQLGAAVNNHITASGGSSGTTFTVNASATGPFGATATGSTTDVFGTSTTGIAKDKSNIFSIPIPCTAPLGTWSVNDTLSSVDLGGNGFSDATANAGTFNTVLPGLIADNTIVVSQLLSGDYGIDQCFTKASKNSTPGSMHIAAQITNPSTCSGAVTVGGLSATLTIPAGFVYDINGHSPAAHVFVGDSGVSYDLEGSGGLTDVTSLVKQSTSGSTISVDFSKLDLGLGAGVFPATNQVYIKSHIKPDSTSTVGADQAFVFSTSASATTVNGFPTPISQSSNYTVIGNPVTSGNGLGCSVDGAFN